MPHFVIHVALTLGETRNLKNIMRLFKLKLGLPLYLNTIFSFAFFVHVTFIAYGIKYPHTPSVKLFTKSFNDLDGFPISFKVCVRELTNQHDRYKKFGYDSVWAFYRGIANDEGTWVGWAGHEDNSSMTSVKGGYCRKNIL